MGTVNESKLKLEATKQVEKLAKVAVQNQNKATNDLIEYVKSQQGRQPKMAVTTAHIVKRFVQGLSAQKGNKRVVFSATLCQLLKLFECIDTKYVYTCIDENYKSTFQVVDNVSRDISRVMGWMTLVKAQRWSSIPVENRNMMVNDMSHCRSHVQVLCTSGLMEIIQQAPSDDFKVNILPHLMKPFTVGWEKCSPDTLVLLIVAYKHHRSAVEKIVKSHWLQGSTELISDQSSPRIADVLGKCSTYNNSMHPLIDVLMSSIVENKLNIVNFWKKAGVAIVNSNLGRSKGAKVLLGMNILLQILPLINTPDQYSAILDKELSSFISAFCSLKHDKETKKSLRSLIVNITEFAAENESVQLDVIKCLIDSAQNPAIYNDFQSFLRQTSPTVQSEYVAEILKTLVNEPSWITSHCEKPVGAVKQFCLKQLNFLFSTVDSTCCLSILQFTFLHSFFTIKQTCKNIPHCVVLSKEINHHDKKILSDTCFKLVSKLLTRQDIGVPKLRNMNEHLDVLYQLSEYLVKLLDSTNNVEMVKPGVSEQITKEWKKLNDIISSIHTKKSIEEITDSHAFELLFICCGLQLLTDTDNVQESLQDLYVCHTKAKKKRKAAAEVGEAAWIDVIVELLLSMVFNDNFLSRVIAKQVMSYLTDHITSTSVQLLIDALEQTRESNESKMVGVGDDDEEDDDDGDDDEKGAMEVDDDDEGSDDDENDGEDDDDDDDEEDDDSGIEEEADLEISDMLKQKVKAALGDAAGATDDEDDGDDDDDDEEKDEESEVEFSDSEMMKLDDVLAAAFRSMRKGKKTEKQQDQQLVSFKTRVLDLVEAVIKGCPPNVTCTSFIMPLLDLVVKGMQKDSDMVLGDKAESVLTTLFKQKQVADPNVNKDSLFELCEKLMDYTRKIPIPSFVQTVGKACLYVLKIIMAEDILSPRRSRSKPSKKLMTTEDYKDKVVTMVKTGVSNLLEHKQGHCKPAFFHILLTSHPALFWELNEPCLETLRNEESKVYLRTQAAAFIADLVTKETSEKIGKEKWNQFIVKCKTATHKIIQSFTSAEKMNKGLLNEIVNLGYSIQTLYPDVKIFEEADLPILLDNRTKADKPGRKLINKLTKDIRPVNEPKKKKRKNEDKNEESSSNKKVKTDDQSTSLSENQSETMTGNQSDELESEDQSEKLTPMSKNEKRKRNNKSKKNKKNKMTENQSENVQVTSQSVSDDKKQPVLEEQGSSGKKRNDKKKAKLRKQNLIAGNKQKKKQVKQVKDMSKVMKM